MTCLEKITHATDDIQNSIPIQHSNTAFYSRKYTKGSCVFFFAERQSSGKPQFVQSFVKSLIPSLSLGTVRVPFQLVSLAIGLWERASWCQDTGGFDCPAAWLIIIWIHHVSCHHVNGNKRPPVPLARAWVKPGLSVVGWLVSWLLGFSMALLTRRLWAAAASHLLHIPTCRSGAQY